MSETWFAFVGVMQMLVHINLLIIYLLRDKYIMIKTITIIATLLTLSACANYPVHVEPHRAYHSQCHEIMIYDTWNRRHIEVVCR